MRSETIVFSQSETHTYILEPISTSSPFLAFEVSPFIYFSILGTVGITPGTILAVWVIEYFIAYICQTHQYSVFILVVCEYPFNSILQFFWMSDKAVEKHV